MPNTSCHGHVVEEHKQLSENKAQGERVVTADHGGSDARRFCHVAARGGEAKDTRIIFVPEFDCVVI